MNACRSDACCQGRKPCPCPDACQVAEAPPIKQFGPAVDALLIAGFSALCVLLAFLIAFVAREPFAFLSRFF